MKPFLALPAFLAACSAGANNPTQVAKDCIHDRAGGSRLTAGRARQVVDQCKVELDAWALWSTEQAYRKPLDRTDKRMFAEFNARRLALDELFLVQLSDEIAPRITGG